MKLLFSIILSIFSISLFSQNIEYTYSRHIYNQVDNSKGRTFDLSGGKVYYVPETGDDTIRFSSEQPATLDQVSIIFQTKTDQDTIWIDWGEDTPVWISGTTDQTKTSDYSTGSTTYNIKIYGDIDKITKFYVYETYVTFGDMVNNIGKMSGLTYLYLRNCSGIATCDGEDIPIGLTYWNWYSLSNLTATINSADIPIGLTTWLWYSLPNLTATVNSADIPVDLTYWYWDALPNLTATVNSEDIPVDLTYWYWYSLPNLTATVNSADIPVGLTTWYWRSLPNLTATVNSADIPVDLTSWTWNTLPNLTANGLSITALSKALTQITMSAITLSTARVDELLASMDTFYAGANLMTANATITLNGTGVGAPTGGESNTNIVSLISKATLQGKTWTFLINKPET